MVTSHSGRRVWWRCEKSHCWEASISDRNNKQRKKGCPYCAGKLVCKGNSLGDKYQLLTKEWSSKNKLSPFDYTSGSSKKVWWICSRNHEWEAEIRNRTIGKGCPYCSPTRKKVCSDNCLATLNPSLAKEWNFDKNCGLTPFSITVSSGKKVWWKCSTCCREWQSSVSNRNRLGNGCPFCQGVVLKDGSHWDSITEAYVYLMYKKSAAFFNCHGKYGGQLKNSKYDFFFPKENKYVEVSGYHRGSRNYLSYLRIVVKKRRFVEKILLATFEFVQIFPNKKITKFVLKNSKKKL